MNLETYKEVAVGNHLLSFGYRLNSFGIGIYISKYSVDISLFPFFVGLEFNGVILDRYFSKMISERFSQLDKTQNS